MFKMVRAIPKPVELLNLAAASAVYILLLVIPPPPFINQVLGQPGWLVLLLLFGLFALLLQQKGGVWEGIQNVLVFVLFAFPLIYKWQFAQFDDFIIGGLLPWSDASSYLQEAQRLLYGLLLTPVGARRPLFHAFLASLLYLTGRNLTVTLAMLTWVNALAVSLVVREVRRSYGAFGASFLLLFAYEFYTRFAGTTMTEQLGFALGNLAVFFLLNAAQKKNMMHALFGLALLSLALIARAGAFFILPVLIVWIGINYRSKTVLWHAAGSAIAVVAMAFILNSVLLKSIGDPAGIPFSNFSYTLYGLASGNKGWTQARYDYPNATESEVMSLAIQKIRSDPALFLNGILGSYLDFFKADGGTFTFISLGSLQAKANVILWILTMTGLVHAVLNWKESTHGLVLASFIGVFASLSLVPPIDANNMRAFAATIPFTPLWLLEGGYAFTSLSKKMLKQKEDGRIEETSMPVQKLAFVFSAFLVVLAFPAPILLNALARASSRSSTPHDQIACGPREQFLQGSMLNNTSINLTPNDAANESYMPFFRIDDFRSAVIRKNPRSYPYLDNELLSLQAGQRISLGYDLNVGNVWLISNFPIKTGRFSVCGLAADNPELRNNYYYFYYLEGRQVSPSSLTISQQRPGITQLIRLLYVLATGVVIWLFVTAGLGFKQRAPVNYLYAIGIMILITPGILVALYAQAILHLPFAEQRIPLKVANAERERGLYILPLGINWMSQDDLGLSPAIVYENGVPLAMPNSKSKSIRYDGNGRYSISNGNLYFSSSDNTDPRTNSRKYELEWPHPIHPFLQWIAYLVSLFGAAILFFRESLMRAVGALRLKFQQRPNQS